MTAMCVVQLKDNQKAMNLMLMLGLCKAIDQLSVSNCERWYGHRL